MARAVGLDIGSNSVKLVEIEGTPKKFKITRYVSREVPPWSHANSEALIESVGDVLKEAKAPRDALVPALNASSVVIRDIMVPFTQDDQIRRVLRYEAEAHLHNYAIEDVVVDHLKVGEVQDQSKVLIFAAPKEYIRDRLDLLKQLEVDPMHMDLDIAALFNAAQAVGTFEENPDCVILDIGAKTTLLIFVRGGKLRGCRSLRTGAESLTRILSEDLAVDTETARVRSEQGDRSAPRPDDLLSPIPLSDPLTDDDETVIVAEQTPEQLENAIVTQRQDDFLTRIHREVARTMATGGTGGGLTAVFITGRASLTPGIEVQLEKRFRLPVKRLVFVDESNPAIPAADYEVANASIGVAMGCALKLIGVGEVDLEFRRDELRYTRKFDLIKVSLASAVSLVFILLFLIWLHFQNTLKVRRAELGQALGAMDQAYMAEVTKDYQTIIPKENAKPLRPVPTSPFAKLLTWDFNLKAMHQHLTNELGFNVEGVPPIRPALQIWNDVSTRLADETLREKLGYLWVDEIRVTQKTLSVKGKIGNRGNIDIIRLEMGLVNGVEDVVSGRTEVDKDGKTRFDLTATLKPLAIKAPRTTPERRPR